MRFFLPVVLLFFLQISRAQVTGRITDQNGEPLPGATVKALRPDSSFVTGTTTDANGTFTLNAAPAKYILVFSAMSLRSGYRDVKLTDVLLPLDDVRMSDDAKQLKEVEVKTVQQRAEQRGDTTSFNAGAFKTNPDASAEDLVKKLPGTTSDQTGLKVNGENVMKVLVDGKPFFGDDAAAALKNLPADVIDKVEVFDRLSDQAQFTGFSDGSEQRMINLVTRKDRRKGLFGRAYGGYGADHDAKTRYSGGAAINRFRGEQRLSVLLLSNNVNQQNFSGEDLAAASSGQQPQRGGPGGGRRSQGQPFQSPVQEGISETQAAGINYTDKWGKSTDFTGSYFFNHTINRNASVIERNYFTNNGLTYDEASSSRNVRMLHRLNLRIELTIDSLNKIIYTPALSLQDNTGTSSLDGTNRILDNVLLSRTSTGAENRTPLYDLNHTLLYQHGFAKRGRTISLGLSHQQGEQSSIGDYNAVNEFSDSSSTLLDQQYKIYGYNKRYGINLQYTEPLGKFSQLRASYQPSYAEAYSDKRTNDRDPIVDEYNQFNTGLSNKYSNTYQVQRGGLSLRYRKEKLNVNVGADVQEARLEGTQEFPRPFEVNQQFTNVLPSLWLNYRFSRTHNLRAGYRSSTNIPNMTQLQDVADVSNPLQVRTGNSALRQSSENIVYVRIGGTNSVTARNVLVYLNGGYTDDYIANATYVLAGDSLIQGFIIRKGSQVTRPVNLDGYTNARLFAVYGFPVISLKCNLNFNGGVNYGRTPALVDHVLNNSSSYAANGGLFIGSNISQAIDFSIGYNAAYTIVRNDRQKESNNNFLTQSANLAVNWISFGRLVIQSDLKFTAYSGLNKAFNQEFTLWNAGIGYKFLKNKSLELRGSVYDLLNQNRSIGRNVTGAYTEDYQTVVLRRYFLVTLTYTVRRFGGNEER
jgi:hypothetical protein